MEKTMKPFKSHKEQVQILIERGLEIQDQAFAESVLSNLNYYMLSGYLYPFKNRSTERFSADVTFEEILNLYYFDAEMRSALLFAVNHIEQRLKSVIAYNIAEEYPDNPLIYENKNFFKNQNEHEKFITSFNAFVQHNSTIPFVEHHIKNYGGHFPIWVASELFTLGNIKFLYRNLPNKLRRKVSSTFDISPDVLDSWIDNLRITRNMLAHDRKLYQTTWSKTPKLPKKYRPEKPLGNKLFPQIYLMKLMFPSTTLWSLAFKKIGTVLIDYNSKIKLKDLGFPSNWQELLQ
ncbi:Abortive infection bacteriophage resistance protein [Pilibacter termitis]|uniref:Abortive infection bacteriophage resistance protein n=1 Tax=Pilibacter termitis TaxID=263852 RepID=A0A1T4R7M2_9ENTE|nr:Abi family protein [Pilibacter termitis]SKA11688.1 Abortive infection bacteriophage resistance protein [Pilibacter termitis]